MEAEEAEEAATKNKSGSEEESDHGWQQVQNRKAKSSKASSGLNDGVYGNGINSKENPKTKINILERMSMSCYLTNFPHQVTAKDMWNRCSKWGTVADVFIPNRLSKAGRRFCFVRFIKVDNAARLLSDLKSMWIGNYLVFADLVKYSRIHEKLNGKSNTKNQEKYGNRASDKGEHGVSKPAMSYVEVLSGPKACINVDINSGKASSSLQERRLVKLPSFSSSNVFEEKAKANLSMLVKIIEPCNIPKTGQWLIDEGFSDFKISYIGGRWLLITLSSMEAKDLFMANELLRCRFSAFKTPSACFVPDERMVWVEVSGLPLGVWRRESIQEIIGDWGKCVFFLDDWERAYSICKVCILANSQKYVIEELQVEIDNKKYDVWMKEFAMWEPRILGHLSDSSDSEMSSQCEEDTDEVNTNDDEGIPSEQFVHNLCRETSHSNFGKSKDVHRVESDLVDSIEEGELRGDSVLYNDRCVKKCMEKNLEDDADIDIQDCYKSFNEKCEEVNNNMPNKMEDETLGEHFESVNAPAKDPNIVSPSTPSGIDLNLANESDSTWLDYVGPLISGELDSEKRWSYRDPKGKVHGLFSLEQLRMWKDYFPSDLQIWSYDGNVKETILLHDALTRQTKDAG